jgi:hypothetical protein
MEAVHVITVADLLSAGDHAIRKPGKPAPLPRLVDADASDDCDPMVVMFGDNLEISESDALALAMNCLRNMC